jgi:hypothetical protein
MGGAALLVKSSRGLDLTAIVGMAVVLAVWAVSRTVGVPIGPDGGGHELIGRWRAAGAVLSTTALVAVYICLREMRPATRRLRDARYSRARRTTVARMPLPRGSCSAVYVTWSP